MLPSKKKKGKCVYIWIYTYINKHEIIFTFLYKGTGVLNQKIMKGHLLGLSGIRTESTVMRDTFWEYSFIFFWLLNYINVLPNKIKPKNEQTNLKFVTDWTMYQWMS
jgi:hypothetical protein